ncbi:putative integral membrane protein [Mycobacterium tuberculosis]|nr:putative integral membrane protein [Mycobacterium tuberculosis]
MNSPLVVGFLACFTLIAAIGAQNAFVLRQGIQREHVLPVVALCTVSDIVLIAAGIAGFGALIGAHPRALNVVKFGGAAFLIGYGLLAARRAWRPVALIPSGATPVRLAEVLVTCAAFTFLNPHVYLDTVVLLGALANEHSDQRWLFGLGAVTASAVWFATLGFGAGRLRGLFTNPGSWRNPRRPDRGHDGCAGNLADRDLVQHVCTRGLDHVIVDGHIPFGRRARGQSAQLSHQLTRRRRPRPGVSAPPVHIRRDAALRIVLEL